MKDDARLLRWLGLTEHALTASGDTRIDALTRLTEQRAELMVSLQATPPSGGSRELATGLEAAERQLESLGADLLRDARKRALELRQAQCAASGYRPPDDRIAAFVSKSI